jgi:hypothetical protein
MDIDYRRPANLVFWDAMAILRDSKLFHINDGYWLVPLGITIGVTGTEPNVIKLVTAGGHPIIFSEYMSKCFGQREEACK